MKDDGPRFSSVPAGGTSRNITMKSEVPAGGTSRNVAMKPEVPAGGAASSIVTLL